MSPTKGAYYNEIDKGRMKCEKCDGAGWLWGYELDDPDEDTYTDSMTQYTCDRCQGTGQEPRD